MPRRRQASASRPRRYGRVVSPPPPTKAHVPTGATAPRGRNVGSGDGDGSGWPTGAVTLTEPSALRAIGHPARLAVIQELFGRRVDRTATELAAVAGGTPSAMSYHLRALERHRVVQRSPAGSDGRKRHWRAAGTSLTIEDSAHAEGIDPDTVIALSLDRTIRAYRAWAQTSRATEDPEVVNSGTLILTDDEARELSTAVDGLIEELCTRRTSGPTPPDVRRFQWLWAAFPDAQQSTTPTQR